MIEETDSIPVKEILTAASPFIKSVIDTFVTPKLEKLKKKFNLDYNKNHVLTEEHFSEYFFRTYKRISILNTLVFNNSQLLLKDIYIPLTIKCKDNNQTIFKIDKFPQEIIEPYGKILITDNAGMGKSTILKKIFIEAIDSRKGVPILVDLRRLSKEKIIIKEIQEQINALEKDFDNSLLLELIKEGGFVILLDGYDEIPISDRELVTQDIQNFINKASNNQYILTSRPENALKSFGDFQEFKIEPLKKHEAYELLRKYDRQGNISSLLIKKLKETEMANISEFLTNPLLVSLLFTAFQHRQTIPFKKHIFYRQVYDANFESHDLTKGESYTHDKYSKLEIDDFHRVLRHIGYSCLKNNQRIEFSKDEILDLIRKAKVFCVGLNFSESDFLKDLLVTVPLFTQDGNYYKWAHKSLQEYFAAQFIYLDSKEQQSKILRQLYNSKSLESFINVLDLYYDIDTKTFRNTLLYDILSEYHRHYNSYFIIRNKSIDKNLIEFRRDISFLQEIFVFTINDKDDGFNHDKLDSEMQRLQGKFSGVIDSPNADKALMCFIKNDGKFSLLQMILKKNPLISETLQHRNKINESLNIEYSLRNEYEFYLLNDNIDDTFNSPNNFEDVNRLIVFTSMYGLKIKGTEAIKLLSDIEESINREMSESFLLDGI